MQTHRLPSALLLVACCSGAAAFDIDAHRITDLMIAAYTPMKANGLELDLDRLPAYAEFLAKRNITNVMPAGSNGESLSLSVVERKALAEAWGRAAPKHGMKVYMHIGSESLVDTMELARHAGKTDGIFGVVAMTPVYFKPTVEGLHDFMVAVAGAAPTTPFWFYHFPDDTGVLPGQAYKFLEMADKSGKIPNLMGIKYTDYNLMDFSRCLEVGHHGKYNMLYGRDEQALSALQMGAEAGVSSTAGYAPSLREVMTLFKAGDLKGARQAQITNAKLCSMFGDFAGDENTQKNIMKMVGMDVGPSRLPKRDLTPEKYAAFEKQLRDADLIDPPAKPTVGSSITV